MSGKHKHWIERRAEAARAVERRCDRVLKKLDGVASFDGKAKVIDLAIAAMQEAGNLAWDLEIDAGDAKRREEER